MNKRPLISLVFSLTILWTVAFFVSFYISPEQEYIDTHRGGDNNDFGTIQYEASYHSMFPNGTVAFIESLFLLRQNSRPKMFIIGSSSTECAFNPQELSVLFPQYDVHNISIRESNVTQIIQEVQIVAAIIPQKVLEKSVFVVGLTYSSFFENKLYKINKIPNLEKHLKVNLSTFFKLSNHSVEPRLPVSILLFYERAIWPFHYMNYLSRILPEAIKNGKLIPQPYPKQPDKSYSFDVPPGMLNNICNDWIGGGPEGIFKDEQFAEFRRLLELVQALKTQTLFVNMPLHPSHDSVRLNQQYQKIWKSFSSPDSHSIQFVDLQGKMPIFAFRDTSHANPNATPMWSHLLWENWRTFQ